MAKIIDISNLNLKTIKLGNGIYKIISGGTNEKKSNNDKK